MVGIEEIAAVKHAYIPILFALLTTAGLVLHTPNAAQETTTFSAPEPVESLPLEDAHVVEVSLRF